MLILNYVSWNLHGAIAVNDAIREIGRFFTEEHRTIIPVTVREILDEQIAHKLA